MQLQSNTELQNGKFRILRVLGQGGFGITYLAENVALGRKVAIKEFFPKDFCGRDETTRAITSFTGGNSELLERLKKRFLKEARNIAALDHPGIVKIHDIFEENGTAYYIMDYIEGENLNEMVKRDGAMPEARAVGYIRKVGETLSYIHGRNMTHFDVKPANIVVRRSDDMPILIDFGLSKQYDIHGDATSTLMQGVSSGYSPLEMYNPAGLTTFSPQTDVYSLGATLYFLLTGKVPPAATELVTDVIQLPSYLNPAVRNAIETAMRPGKAQRVESIDEFLILLDDIKGSRMSGINSANSRLDNEVTRLIEIPLSISSKNMGKATPTTTPSISSSLIQENGKRKGYANKSFFRSLIFALTIVVIVYIVILCSINDSKSDFNDFHNEEIYDKDSTEAFIEDRTNGNKNISEVEKLNNENVENLIINTEKIFVNVEEPAEFPGGERALIKWLKDNINYPESAKKNGIEGRVVVQFVVEEDGSIEQASIIKGVSQDLDREALRVVLKMPKWHPGKNDGISVRSYFNLPITFRLSTE